MENKETDLIQEALKVYKIPERYVFASREIPERGEVVIVTHGGKKIRHKKGEAAKFELTYTEISGELPKEEMIWDKKLNQRVPILSRLFSKGKK